MMRKLDTMIKKVFIGCTTNCVLNNRLIVKHIDKQLNDNKI